MESSKKEELIRCLTTTGCLKFGQFTLKSGEISQYYIDLRESTLNYTLFEHIVESLKRKVTTQLKDTSNAAIVGVPYGVVPIAAVLAYELKIPYFPVRKEVKPYGNKTECHLPSDHRYILIEDVMSTGSSIIETIKKLDAGRVSDVIVVVNREAGGDENLKTTYPDIKVHSIVKASEILDHQKSHT